MSTTIERMLQSLKSSAKDLPTPMYIVNVPELKNSITAMQTGFSMFPNFIFGYSVKTNGTEPVLQIIESMGGYAEIVSPYELKIARRYFPLRKIIYNGVIPDVTGKFEVASHGGTVNIENLYELHAIDEYAGACGRPIDVGLRINLNIDGLCASRFGIEFGPDLIAEVRNAKNLHVAGIHCHVTKARELCYWKERARQMSQISKQLGGCRYIDLGGNMYGTMRPEVAQRYKNVPTFFDYAKTIYAEFKSEFSDENMPALILEPGTPLIASAQAYLTRANIIKQVAGMTAVTLDGKAMDIEVFTDPKNRFPLHVLTDSSNSVEDATLFGCTCTEIDVFKTGYTGPLDVGDRVLFDNVGAYSNTLESSFICGKPGIASYDETGEFKVFRMPG